MNKLIGSLLLALVLVLPVSAQEINMGFLNHPNFANINTRSVSFVGTIKTYQDQFFALNGRYFQGIALLGYGVQPDGTTDIQTVNTQQPTDQNVSWRDFASSVFRSNLKIPIQLRIDVYEAPSGWGWVMVAEVWYPGLGPDRFGNNGDHWMFRHVEGPASTEGQILDEWFILVEE